MTLWLFLLSIVKQSFVSSALLAGRLNSSCLSINLHIHSSIQLYILVSIYPFFYPSFYLFISSMHGHVIWCIIYHRCMVMSCNLFIHISVHLSIYSSIFLSIHLSNHPSIGRSGLRTGCTAAGSGCISLSTLPLEYVLLFLVWEYSMCYGSSVCDE